MNPSKNKAHPKKTQKPNRNRRRCTNNGAPSRHRKRGRDGNARSSGAEAGFAVKSGEQRYTMWYTNAKEQLMDIEYQESLEEHDVDEGPCLTEEEIECQNRELVNMNDNLLSKETETMEKQSKENRTQNGFLGDDRENYEKVQYVTQYRDMHEQVLDLDKLNEMLEEAKETWNFEWNKDLPVSVNLLNWYQDVTEKLGIKFDAFDSLNSQLINDGYKKQVIFLGHLFSAFMSALGKTDDLEEDIEDYKLRLRNDFDKIFRNLYYMSGSIESLFRAMEVLSPTHDHLRHDEFDLTRYAPVDTSECNTFQNLLLYILFRLSQRRYRKYGEFCYEAIYNSERHYTFAWKQSVEIKKFIYLECQKESNFEQWKNLTAGGGNRAEQLTKFLQECQDQQFPELVKDRHMFAFENGLYITNIEGKDGKLTDMFYEYKNVDWSKIDPHKVACKYFKQDFCLDEPDDWYDIKTPHFQGVLDYQWSEKVQKEKGFAMTSEEAETICRWLYVFMGRMLYEVGELKERWEVAPFLIGIGGCGKSTISNCLGYFFDEADVGYISNHIDPNFGVAALKDKFIAVAPEIHDDFTLDQTEFQKMISGEAVKIRQMYKDPKHVTKWTVPIFLVGNASANYDDKQGQISRRLVFFFFNVKVKDEHKNPNLMQEIKNNEIPALIKKCNRAYLEYVEKYKDKDIWHALPQYFKKLQNRFNKNPLYEFLRQDNIKMGSEWYVPWDTFKQKFITYCQMNNWGHERINREDCAHIFAKYTEELSLKDDIHIRDNIIRDWPPGSNRMKKGTYIIGISFSDVGIIPILAPDPEPDQEDDEEEDVEMDEVQNDCSQVIDV